MKRLLLGAAAAAMTLTGFAASAQPYGGRYDQHRSYDSGRNYGQQRDWNRGGSYGDWRQGQVYSGYARRDRMIGDWRAYHLPAPRAGYGYYREDNGDVVMAALASGLIGLVIGGALSDHGSYGYSQPTYQQPYYGYGGGYGGGYGYQSYGYRR
jgi:Ni/Co efflux regulator RcnB